MQIFWRRDLTVFKKMSQNGKRIFQIEQTQTKVYKTTLSES